MLTLFLLPILSGASCHRREKRTEPVQWPVGWTMDSPADGVHGGRLLTTPPGHEEEVLTAVANAIRIWAKGCSRSGPMGKSHPIIRLAVSDRGVVRSVGGAIESPFVKCLVENGHKLTAPVVHGGIDRIVDVALDLGDTS